MKKLFLLGLIALQSGSVFAADTYCNPCWIVEQLFEKIRTAKTADEVVKLNELIESNFGPACKQHEAAIVAENREKIIFGLTVAAAVAGTIVVIAGINAIYDTITSSKKSEVEALIQEDIQF